MSIIHSLKLFWHLLVIMCGLRNVSFFVSLSELKIDECNFQRAQSSAKLQLVLCVWNRIWIIFHSQLYSLQFHVTQGDFVFGNGQLCTMTLPLSKGKSGILRVVLLNSYLPLSEFQRPHFATVLFLNTSFWLHFSKSCLLRESFTGATWLCNTCSTSLNTV